MKLMHSFKVPTSSLSSAYLVSGERIHFWGRSSYEVDLVIHSGRIVLKMTAFICILNQSGDLLLLTLVRL